MHEPYDDFEEEDYYKKDNAQNQYEKFFSIDASLWEKYGQWISGLTDDLAKELKTTWYVYPASVNNDFFYYLGIKNDKSEVYKNKSPIPNLDIEYKKHIQAHAKYFLEEPSYYKNLYEILN
jgi:hypothetical protein